MKIQIRAGVFETNSSSVHSVTICTQEEYEGWEDDRYYYNNVDKTFSPVDDYRQKQIEKMNKVRKSKSFKDCAKNSYEKNMNKFSQPWNSLSAELKEEWYNQYWRTNECKAIFDLEDEDRDDEEHMTRAMYNNNYVRVYDTFKQEYQTPNGEQIVVFGYWGYD